MQDSDPTGGALPTELIQDLESIQAVEGKDRATVLHQLLSMSILLWKMDHYLEKFAAGAVSLAQAANGAGVTLWEMMDYASARKVASQYDLSEFQHDWATIQPKPEKIHDSSG